MEGIGIGIVTCQPRESFFKCFDSVDFITRQGGTGIIINDGKKGGCMIPRWSAIQNETNLGVGKSKNKALEFLLKKGCEHIFLIEDDIFVKDRSVFHKYIEASKKTGIQHFNYSQHGMMNKSWPGGAPNPRTVLDYGGVKVALYPHCVGAFSYYSRKCLEDAGLMDERYYNACEHVDHTLEIINKGMHPPFWYFADIENSQDYLGDEEWSLKQSTISSREDHKEIVSEADKIFFSKHGCYPGQIPLTSEDVLVEKIKEIKKNYGN